MKKYCGVYAIKVNGEVRYIGSSKNIMKRKSCHLANLRHNKHNNENLQKDYDTYGEDAFIFEILEECLVKDLFILEQQYMKMYSAGIYNQRIIKNTEKNIRRGKESNNYKELRSEVTSGANNGHCGTTIEQIKDIKRWIQAGKSNKEIAELVEDKTSGYIQRIRSGDRWSSVTIDEPVELLAVSMKSTPVFKGDAAKRLIDNLENPKDNSELFEKCRESAKMFVRK